MMRDLTEVFGEHQLDLGGHDTNFLGDDASEMGDDHTFGGSPPEIDQDLEAPGHVEEYHNPMSVHMMEDTIDDSPMSPPARPPRPETADSILDSQPPTPITVNFGSIQEPMTPGGMSQERVNLYSSFENFAIFRLSGQFSDLFEQFSDFFWLIFRLFEKLYFLLVSY